jgi:hypothetical protein
MLSLYYLYYRRIWVAVKQRIIDSDAKPGLWIRLKRTHLWCEGLYYEDYVLRRSIVEVTDLREGGDVRGSPLAVIIVLEWSLWQHIPCRDVQGGLVVYLLAGVYASHEKSSKVASGFERPGPWEVSFTTQKLCGTCLKASTAVDSQLQVSGLFTAWP